MRVIYKPTGQLGDIPDDKFDPSLFTVPEVEQQPSVSNTQQKAPVVNTQSKMTAPILSKNKSVGGFVDNVISSGMKNAGDIVSGLVNVVNPNMDENTIVNLGKLGLDTAKLISGDKNENNRAKKVMEFYKDRYGGLDKAAETLYTDPVGVALDASTVLGGAGLAVKGAGNLSKSAKLGKIGNTLTKASKVIDPLTQTATGINKGLGAVEGALAKTTKSVRGSASSSLAKHSIKAKPTQIVKFEELTGQDLGDFMRDNNIYTTKDVNKAIVPLQNKYNSMVRTGKPVAGSVFADNLRKKAMEMINDDMSPSARQVAERLWNEADTVDKMGNVTDTILANSKTSAYSKVSAKAMTDPITDNFHKAYGEVGIQTLEEGAKGSSQIGKQLQALREFQDIVKTQSGLGKGAQLFNTLRPGVGGALVGNLVPGIGPIAGAVIGEVVTNPTTQRVAAKALQGSIPGAGIAKKIASPAYQAGKVISRLDPQSQPDLLDTTPIETASLEQPIMEDTYTNNIAENPNDVNFGGSKQGLGELPAPKPQYQNQWGASPTELYREYQNAYQFGDIKTAAYLYKTYQDEIKHQKDVAKSSGKSFTAGQLKELSDIQNSIDLMDSLTPILDQNAELFGPIKGQLGKNPYATESKALEAEFRTASQLVGKAMEGGVLRKEDEEKYRKMLPQITDTPAVARRKIENVRKMVKMQLETKKGFYSNYDIRDEYPNTSTQTQDMQFLNEGLGETPPTLEE